MWKQICEFLKDEDGSSDVEYILISTFVVPLIFFTVPPILMAANVRFFDRIHIWTNLPFP
ncbi:MAG: Flp family type IVb pilin [Planctomycetota bacterium]|nr:Flp family type IVb pilin [Planctomycetota bacterium]